MKKMYLAMRLSKSIKVGSPMLGNAGNADVLIEDKDVAGICYAFKSKAAAVRMYGPGVEVIGIELKEPT